MDDEIRTGLTDEQLWVSENPRHGVVRQVLVDGPFAVVFDDLNADYREVALTVFDRGSDGLWGPILYGDDVHIPAVGESIGPWQDDYLFACGRSEPHADVAVPWKGDAHTMRANAEGWWLVCEPLSRGIDW